MSSVEELQKELEISKKQKAELEQRCEQAEQGRNKLKQQLGVYHRVVQEAKWLPQKVQQLSTELQSAKEELSKEKERSMNNSSSSEHRVHFDQQIVEQMRGKLDQTHQQLQQQQDTNKGFQDKLAQIEGNVQSQISSLMSTINKQQEALRNVQTQNQELLQSKQELQHNIIKQNAALVSIKSTVKELMQFQGHWGTNVTHVQSSVQKVQQQLTQINKSITEFSQQKRQIQQIYQPDLEVAAAIEDLQDQCHRFQNQLSEVGRIGDAASAFFTALYGKEPPRLSVYDGPTLSNSSLNANENNVDNTSKQKKILSNNNNNHNHNDVQIVRSERPTKRQKTIHLDSILQDLQSLRNEEQIQEQVKLILQQCSDEEEIGNAFILSIQQCAHVGAVDITHVKQINWKLVQGQGRHISILAQMPWCISNVEQFLWLIKGWCMTRIDFGIIIKQLQQQIIEGIHNFQQQQHKQLPELCVTAAALVIFCLMNRKMQKSMRIWVIDVLSLGNTQVIVPILSIVLSIWPNLMKTVQVPGSYTKNSSPQTILSLIVQQNLVLLVKKCDTIAISSSTTQGSILRVCTDILKNLGQDFWQWPVLEQNFDGFEQFVLSTSQQYASQQEDQKGRLYVKGLCLRLVACTQCQKWVCGNLVSELLEPDSDAGIIYLKQILIGLVLRQGDDRGEQNSQIAFVLQACRSMINKLSKETKLKTYIIKLILEILLLVHNQCDRMKAEEMKEQCRSCLSEVTHQIEQYQDDED